MSNAVRSQNPFELLGDDDAGTGVLPTPKPKPAAPKPAPAAAAAPAAAKKAPAGARANGGARSGNNRSNRDVQASEPGSTGEKIQEDREHHGGRASRPAGAGRGRGKRGGAHFGAGAISHGGFDKKSGGHADTHKRVESGWGAETGAAELADEQQGAEDAKADVQAVTPGAATPIGAADVAGSDSEETKKAAPKEERRERKPQAEEEEEDNTQTYAEWAAAKAAAAIEGVSQLAKRVVGDWEGEGEVLQKKGDDAFFAAKEKARIAKEKAPKKVKETLQIDGKFAPVGGNDRPARGGRGGARGGAEGGRGFNKEGGNPRGAGRGGPRGGRGGARGGASAPAARKAPAADINDATAFPSLS